MREHCLRLRRSLEALDSGIKHLLKNPDYLRRLGVKQAAVRSIGLSMVN